MISEITIENFIIIDNLSINLGNSFISVTGETGTGKSLIVDAIEFCIGKFNSKTIRKNQNKNVSVTLCFEEKSGKKTTIKRSSDKNNKSSFFIDGALSSSKTIKELCSQLLDITSQFDSILNESTHDKILDRFMTHNIAESREILSDVYSLYYQIQETDKKINDIKEAIESVKNDKNYYNSIIEDLTKISIQKDEEINLISKRTEILKMFSSKNHISDALSALRSVQSIESKIFSAVKSLDRPELADLEHINEIKRRLDAIAIDFKDTVLELELAQNSMSDKETELLEIDERLSIIRSFARKYNTPSSLLFELLESSEKKIKESANYDKELAFFIEQKQLLTNEYLKLSDKLSCFRKQSAKILSEKVTEMLSSLLLDNSVFEINIKKSENKIFDTGTDIVEFLADFNKLKNSGNSLNLITETASGGESARLNFALKTVLSKCFCVETVVFDEIDIGIGGRAAHAMGIAMKNLAKNNCLQVIAITHSPQIAAMSDEHISVRKTVSENNISISAIKMCLPQRTEEIARMISGAVITKDAIAAARKLIEGI